MARWGAGLRGEGTSRSGRRLAEMRSRRLSRKHGTSPVRRRSRGRAWARLPRVWANGTAHGGGGIKPLIRGPKRHSRGLHAQVPGISGAEWVLGGFSGATAPVDRETALRRAIGSTCPAKSGQPTGGNWLTVRFPAPNLRSPVSKQRPYIARIWASVAVLDQ